MSTGSDTITATVGAQASEPVSISPDVPARTKQGTGAEEFFEKFEEALRTMPKAGHGVGFNDHALPRAARLAQLAGVPMEDAVRLIHETQTGAERETEGEIRSTVERIYEDDEPSGRRRKKRKPAWPEYDPALALSISQSEPKTVDDLVRLSPEQGLVQRSSFHFLQILLPGSPLVTTGQQVIFTRPASGQHPSKDVVTYRAETFTLSEGNAHRFEGMGYIVATPAIRRFVTNKDGTISRHCSKMYGPRHHLVLESDKLSKDQWAGVLLHLAQFAPLVMVVDSAGKSLHGFFDCEGVPESVVETFFSYAHRLGADAAMMKVMQFSRLPNGTRLGGARQRVLYFDPSAKGRAWNLSNLPGNSVVMRSIFDIPQEDETGSNLLGNRFLCRGKAVLVPGPTGVGKSTLGMQASVLFATGRDFFGLKPEKPLRVLIVQSENDSVELQEMVVGAVTGAKLNEDERQRVRENVFYVTMNDGANWMEQLEPMLEQFQPDIIVVDPLFAFFSGSVSEQAAMSPFLRGKLQPFLEKHQMGLILCHHINKPSGNKKDRPDWQSGDFAYFGSGSNEIANWCKGVLALRSIGKRDVFELVVGKRHQRAQLRDKKGEIVDRLLIRHSRDPDLMYWELADEDDGVTEAQRDNITDLGKAYRALQHLGEVKVQDLADEMGVCKKTVNRIFEGKEFVELPANGDKPALKLSRKRGRIYGHELRADDGVTLSFRKNVEPAEQNAAQTGQGQAKDNQGNAPMLTGTAGHPPL